MTKKERLEAIIAYYSNGKPSVFARFLGVAPSTISSWLARDTFDSELLFAKCEMINPDWLLTGEGSMLKTIVNDTIQRQCRYDADTMPTSQTAQNDQQPANRRTLPLIPIDAVAGYNGWDEPGISLIDCAQYDIPDFQAVHADFLIRVSGSSMYPKYSSGDILACRKVPEVTFIQWGKIYVIDSCQGAMVKRLFQIDDKPDHLLCKSDNTNYPPFELPKSEIRSLSIVVGAIRLE